MAQVRKEPNPFGMQMQGAESPARGADGLSQRLNPRRLHVPKEAQREVKLLTARPANAALRHYPAQLRLGLLHLCFNALGHCDRHEEPELRAIGHEFKSTTDGHRWTQMRTGLRVLFPRLEGTHPEIAGRAADWNLSLACSSCVHQCSLVVSLSLLPAQGIGSPRAAMSRRYHSSRVNARSAALAASRMRSGLIVPMMGIIRAGCLRSHASATTVRLAPRALATESRTGRKRSG